MLACASSLRLTAKLTRAGTLRLLRRVPPSAASPAEMMSLLEWRRCQDPPPPPRLNNGEPRRWGQTNVSLLYQQKPERRAECVREEEEP